MSTNETTFILNSTRQFTLNDAENKFQSLIDLFPDQIKDKDNFNGLKRTIDRLQFNIYSDLLPKIAEWASEHHRQSKLVKLLHSGTTRKIHYTAKQIRYILANAFLLNVTAGYGNLDLFSVYNSDYRLAEERILCLIEYFRLSAEENDERNISIERYSYADELLNWNEQHQLIESSKIHVTTDRMENMTDAQGFIDFANKNIHIHRIISSATQEEVLFSCCPEAFISILLCQTLSDDEVVILRGCKRFIDYSGYGDTFRFVGPYQNQQQSDQIQDIIVIDACYSQQFQKNIIDRDLNKAWAGFSKSNDQIIVTGHWGCGVFGGDFFLKFLQQVCVTIVLDSQIKRLDYSVYGDENLAQEFRTLLKRLQEKKITVADIYQLMIKYHETGALPATRLGFRDYVNQSLTLF